MKKIQLFVTFVLIAAMGVMFSSCSKEAKIAGSWEVTHDYTKKVLKDKVTEQNDEELGVKYVFNDDGTGTFGRNGLEMTYTCEGDSLFITVNAMNSTLGYFIEELKGSSLILTGSHIESGMNGDVTVTERKEFKSVE